MNIIIDTNILIPLEDTGREMDSELAEMKRLCAELNYKLHTHPEQYKDIEHDKNVDRRNIILSRIGQYIQIHDAPIVNDSDVQKYNWSAKNENDEVDNSLLIAIVRGACHILVTNDNGIHRKARQANISEQVHRQDQFLNYLKNKMPSRQGATPAGIETTKIHGIDVSEPFFNSLRAGYDGFDQWFKKSAQDGREAWCVFSDDAILDAICVFKEETGPAITDDNKVLNGRVLKLCTFKVGKDSRGNKIGERMLYTAFKHAKENNYEYVYLHVFGEEHKSLVSLCEEYGFEASGDYKGQQAYVKSMIQNASNEALDNLQYAIRYYPNFRSSKEVRKFIVPIQPPYHEILFPDVSNISKGLFRDSPTLYLPASNTIKKAYICHASTTRIHPGDILLFYRSEDRQSVECLGVVEYLFRSKEESKVMSKVFKRTVYTQDELSKMLKKGDVLVILFRLVKYFQPIQYDVMKKNGIDGPYQSVRSVPHDAFIKCFGAIL